MKEIGALSDEAQARLFGDHLLCLGVRSLVEEAEGRWVIWVFDQNQLETAREELAAFVAAPEDARYSGAGAYAKAVREGEAKREKARRRNVVDTQARWRSPAARCPATLALILLSVAAAVFTNLGENKELREAFFILPSVQESIGHLYEQSWPDVFARAVEEIVARGEYWRLVTPVFLHLGIFHILFNMMWLRELGNAIEFRRGSGRFLAMVLVMALLSNFAQFLVSGPQFGGMSGVVYGLFGYIWMKGKFDPTDQLVMPQSTVYWMMGWFLLCLTGILPIANTAHGVGLVVGMAMGLGSARLRQVR